MPHYIRHIQRNPVIMSTFLRCRPLLKTSKRAFDLLYVFRADIGVTLCRTTPLMPYQRLNIREISAGFQQMARVIVPGKDKARVFLFRLSSLYDECHLAEVWANSALRFCISNSEKVPIFRPAGRRVRFAFFDQTF